MGKSHIALDYLMEIKERGKGRDIQFPQSAVFYLQHSKNTPKELNCTFCFSNGEVAEYIVPVIKIQEYSLKEIAEKHLEICIPFLPLRFRKRLKTKTNKPTVEELEKFFFRVLEILERDVVENYFTIIEMEGIVELLNKVNARVFEKEKDLKGVVEGMTKSVIKFQREIAEELREELRCKEEEIQAIREENRRLHEKLKHLQVEYL